MKAVDSAVAGIYGIIADKQAPAQIGKPIFENDLMYAKACGAESWPQLIGHKDSNEDTFKSRPLNFGSKADTLFMPDDVRLRLFNLKKCINDCEVQAMVMFKTAHPTKEQFMDTPMFKRRLVPMGKSFNVTD